MQVPTIDNKSESKLRDACRSYIDQEILTIGRQRSKKCKQSLQMDYELCLEFINKMYGVDAELMRRMQRRIKEKIYREMIEEEEKQRRKVREEKAKSREFQFRNHTQPNERNIRKTRPNRYEDDSPSSLIDQESSFLPVINSRQRPSIEEESANPSYKEYVQKREDKVRAQRSKSRYNKRSSTSAALPTDYDEEGQESQEEKAEKYLTQCEQIICNLREITKKNNKKATQRERTYEPPSPTFASKNKSFNGTLTPKEPIRESLTYSSKRNEPISLRIVRPSQSKNEEIGYEYERVDPRKSIGMRKTREEEEPNQFYQFQQSPSRYPPKVNTRKLSSLQTTQNEAENSPSKSGSKNLQSTGEGKPYKMQKARQNFKRLSPIKTQVQEADDSQSKGQDKGQQQQLSYEEEEQQKRKDKKGIKDSSSKKQPKTSSNPKKGGEEEQAIDEQPNDEAPSNNLGYDSKKEKEKQQKQKARQKAIVKYLKKARMRGNLLYQKMESQKPGQQQSIQPSQTLPEGANAISAPKDSK